MEPWRIVAVALLGVLLCGCATESYFTSDSLNRAQGKPRILVLPADVQLYELSLGGMLEPNAEWTQSARSSVNQALTAQLAKMNVSFVAYAPPPEDSPEFLEVDQVQRLNRAVGSTIQAFHFSKPNRLPSKHDRFDWSLGPSAAILRRAGEADYALFVVMSDSYSSPGRQVFRVLTAAAIGYLPPGGVQQGYASLVDLKTGEVVWFNRLQRGGGELRSAEPAAETVAQLLDKMPK